MRQQGSPAEQPGMLSSGEAERGRFRVVVCSKSETPKGSKDHMLRISQAFPKLTRRLGERGPCAACVFDALEGRRHHTVSPVVHDGVGLVAKRARRHTGVRHLPPQPHQLAGVRACGSRPEVVRRRAPWLGRAGYSWYG